PQAVPVRIVQLPVRPDVPRFDVGGPVIASDLAVVSSSQFGFIAFDWRTATLAWTKPAGVRVAPPVAVSDPVAGDAVALVGDCTAPIDVPEGHDLLGCLRLVTLAGSDRAYIAIHGASATVRAFVTAPGLQDMWIDGEHAIRWRRGDQAVVVDLVSGIATPTSAKPPPVRVTYKDRTWDIERTEERIIARLVTATGSTEAWTTKHPYTALLGAVWLPEHSPMIRVTRVGPWGGIPEVNLLDIDATGSLHGQAAFPVPGISVLGSGISRFGDVALAVRLDKSIQRDFIAGYAANALMMWVYPLPVVPRADPVGVAIAPDAVVVFHDGDTVTILPELSAPPTAAGGGRPASEIPTP
ncbi:MAG: hypothetical protein H0T79_01920, partial [Deltaproteobacteria bacterium]|nr:hypothetical protein [Deltaproteobacteria bacterium]